jgi:hypothetical protein
MSWRAAGIEILRAASLNMAPDDPRLPLCQSIMAESAEVDALEQEEAAGAYSIAVLLPATGKAFAINIFGTDTILTVKNKIQHVEGIPAGTIRLVFAEDECSDTDICSDIGLDPGCGVQAMVFEPIVVRRSGLMHADQSVTVNAGDPISTLVTDILASFPSPGGIILTWEQQ